MGGCAGEAGGCADVGVGGNDASSGRHVNKLQGGRETSVTTDW